MGIWTQAAVKEPSMPPRPRHVDTMRLAIGVAGGLLLLLLALPVLALLARAVDRVPATAALLDGAILSAIRLSLITTGISVVVISLLGTPLAYAFARYDFPLKRLLNVLVELPIVMPPVVAGLALLMAFGRRGLVGPALETVGISLAFTPAAVVLAQIFVATPFYVRAVQSRFESIPREIEDAAGMDGAGPWRTFSHVTLPLSRRAMLAGLILSWARALGEFGATILFAGSLQGRTQTLPLLVYGALERDLDTALWTGLLLIGVAAATLAAVHGLSRFLDGDEARDPLSQPY